MVRVTLTDGQGNSTAIEQGPGASLMEAAVEREIAGIEAQCYGAGVCATCHVYVDEEWFGATGSRSDWEKDMLDALALSRPNSRLSCQITLSDAIDGARFIIPARQESLE